MAGERDTLQSLIAQLWTMAEPLLERYEREEVNDPETDKLFIRTMEAYRRSVRQAFFTCSTVDELHETLSGSGYEENTDILEARWILINERNIEHYVNETPELPIDDLPSTKITRDGIEYLVHGLVHGSDDNRPSQTFVDFVKSCYRRYRQPKRGEDCLLEQNLYDMFGLDYVQDMRDHEWNLRTIPLTERFVRGLRFWPWVAKALYRRLRAGKSEKELPKAQCYKYAVLEEHQKAYLQLGDLSMNDPKYLHAYREASKNVNLPVALRLDRLKKLELYGESEKRSEYMAAYMTDYARRKKLRRLHAIVGLAHEGEMAYFLEDPSRMTRKHDIEAELRRSEKNLRVINAINPFYHVASSPNFFLFAYGIAAGVSVTSDQTLLGLALGGHAGIALSHIFEHRRERARLRAHLYAE